MRNHKSDFPNLVTYDNVIPAAAAPPPCCFSLAFSLCCLIISDNDCCCGGTTAGGGGGGGGGGPPVAGTRGGTPPGGGGGGGIPTAAGGGEGTDENGCRGGGGISVGVATPGGLLVDVRLVSSGDDTCLAVGGGVGANSGGGANGGKSFLLSDALKSPSGCEAVCLNVEEADSDCSCRVGRGWIDMEGGANLEDCARRRIPAYHKKSHINSR